jgi:hypothetical protein
MLANEVPDGNVVTHSTSDDSRVERTPSAFSAYLEMRREVENYELAGSMFQVLTRPGEIGECAVGILWLTSPTSDESELIEFEMRRKPRASQKKRSVLDLLSPPSKKEDRETVIPTTPEHSPPPSITYSDDDEVLILDSNATEVVTEDTSSVMSAPKVNILDDSGTRIANYVTDELAGRDWDGKWRVDWKSSKTSKTFCMFKLTVKFYRDVHECFLVLAKRKKDEKSYTAQLRNEKATKNKATMENWITDSGTGRWFTHHITPPGRDFDVSKIAGLTAQDGQNFKLVGDMIVNRMKSLYESAHSR